MDQRQYGAPRLMCDAAVEIYWGSERLLAKVRDVSIVGMFIESLNPLWLGATFVAKLMLEPPLEMTCTVRRVVPRCGMGVQISFSDAETITRYARELKKLTDEQLKLVGHGN